MSHKLQRGPLFLILALCLVAAAIDVYFDTRIASPIAWALSALLVFAKDAPRSDD